MGRQTNLVGNPPPLSIMIPKLEDLQVPFKPWERVQLPTDVLLLIVTDDEFLACFSYLDNAFKSYNKELGHVYFEEIRDGQKKVKVSLIRCCRGYTQVGASQNVVRTAIEILKPKAVFSVGCCGGLRKDKTKLGDVVISSKLSTYGENKIIGDRQRWCGNSINVSRNIGDLIRTAADGWRAPLLDPEALEVEVHRDAEILSGPELTNSIRECQKLLKRFPGATAIEEEGQGQIVDEPLHGPAPGPLDVMVQQSQMFTQSSTKVEVPHTASVKPCHECYGGGYKQCKCCLRRGWV